MNPNLVFASGFLVPQKIAGLRYFKDLDQFYPEETTLFPPVSVLGSVQLRAQELADRIVKKFPTGEIHVIAHSMGGLDARCLLAKNLNGLTGRIRSLSMISTPHRGSPVADLLLGDPLGLEFPFSNLLAQFATANAHALVDLTSTGAPGFTNKDPVPGIRYFAYAGSGVVSALLFATHILYAGTGGDAAQGLASLIEAAQGGNDGMVSVLSATWPTNLAEKEWGNADHFAEIGYDLNRPDLTTSFPFKDTIARIVDRATS
jgi:triacylglycerol esterase/lipase EstA (alpha/beta hydrolase family)